MVDKLVPVELKLLAIDAGAAVGVVVPKPSGDAADGFRLRKSTLSKLGRMSTSATMTHSITVPAAATL
jgi:hypothetical protein